MSNEQAPPRIPPEALDAIREGRRIEAIRIVHEALGLDLRLSKQLVEAHEAASGTDGTDPAHGELVDAAGFQEQVAELVRRGRKLEAIKRVRDLTQLGLKEAKDLVEGMAAGEPGDALLREAMANRGEARGTSGVHAGAAQVRPPTVQDARGGRAWIVALIVLAAAAAYWLATRGG